MAKPDLIPSRGAVAEALLLEVERNLTAEDLLRLADAPKVSVPILQKLRATHHRQAMLLAEGKNHKEVAAIVGCTPQRLVQLMVDPMFQELLHYYQDQLMVNAMEGSKRLQEKILDAGEMAVDELIERLEDPAKRAAMQTDQVRKIAEFGMDRTVAPPKTAVPPSTAPVSVTLNFGTSLRDPAIAAKTEQKTIEGKTEEQSDE